MSEILFEIGVASTLPPGMDLSRRGLSDFAVEAVCAFFGKEPTIGPSDVPEES